jgi:putative transposase
MLSNIILGYCLINCVKAPAAGVFFYKITQLNLHYGRKSKASLKEHLGKIKTTKGISDVLGDLFKEAVQEMLQAEMDEHLGYEKNAPNSAEFKNGRNGKTRKTVKSKFGQTQIEVPRDRESSFEPQLIPKRKRVMEEIEDHVLSLYTHGMSTRDIENHSKDLYDIEMSEGTVSHITDRVIDHIEQWKSRRLEKVYMVVWMLLCSR